MKSSDHFIMDYHCIPGVSNIGMTVDASNSKCYGIFEVPEEAAKLAQGKPFPYRLKVDHNVKDLWMMNPDFHPNPEDFENPKKEFRALQKKMKAAYEKGDIKTLDELTEEVIFL